MGQAGLEGEQQEERGEEDELDTALVEQGNKFLVDTPPRVSSARWWMTVLRLEGGLPLKNHSTSNRRPFTGLTNTILPFNLKHKLGGCLYPATV